MLIKIDKPALFSKSIEIISELVTEVRIKFNEFGLSINAIDPANVAMVALKIPKSAFSQFEAGNETIGINLDSLKQILKRCSSSGSVIMEKKENYLNIQIQDRIKRDFTIGLMDIESEDKEMPNLEFSSLVEINSLDLVSSIEDCGIVADACAFVIRDGKFIIEAKGMNSARSEFSGDEARIIAENCKSKYSLEYLQKFMKGAKMAEKTELKFADDHPLRMNVRADHIELSFILAPRVDIED